MPHVRTETADTLRGLAMGESSVVEGLLGVQENLEDSGLDRRLYALVKLAALIALGAPQASFDALVPFALDAGATAEERPGRAGGRQPGGRHAEGRRGGAGADARSRADRDRGVGGAGRGGSGALAREALVPAQPALHLGDPAVLDDADEHRGARLETARHLADEALAELAPHPPSSAPS